MDPGISLMHKPIGPTSFTLVKACIDELKLKQPHRRARVCHGGTLDPFASGLLLMLTGSGTRLFDYLHAVPKVYHTTVKWGVETDNGDLNGAVLFRGDESVIHQLSPEKLDDALQQFLGWHEQVPPATSAKRIDGERAYLKAHRGEKVDMPAARVYMHSARWLSHDLPNASRVEIIVRGGYYVRAFARDLGKILNVGAHLSELHRVSIGPWNDPGEGVVTALHGREILPWAKSRILSDQDVGDLRHGQTIRVAEVLPPDWKLPDGFPEEPMPIRGYHQNRLVFLLEPSEQRLKAVIELPGGL